MYYKLLFSFEVSILFSHDRAFLSLSHGSPPGLLSLLGQFDLSPRRNAWAFSWKGMLFFFHPFPWVSARLNLTPIFPHPQILGTSLPACLRAHNLHQPKGWNIKRNKRKCGVIQPLYIFFRCVPYKILLLIYRLNFVFRKFLKTRRHLGFGCKTVNSRGYSELR